MIAPANVITFLTDRVPELQTWPAGRPARWWRWFEGQGLTAILTERGRIIGAGAARITDEAHLEDVYHHDPRGNVVYIVVAAADTPAARRGLWACLLTLLGPRPLVAYHRGGRLRRAAFPRFQTLFEPRRHHDAKSTRAA